MEEILLYAVVLNLGLVLAILVARGRARRLHTLVLFALLLFTLYLLQAGLTTGPVSTIPLWLFLFLLLAPAFFFWLLRLLSRGRHYRLAALAAALFDLTLLQRGSGQARMLLDVSRARAGKGEEAIARARQAMADAADRGEGYRAAQQLLHLLMAARRFEEGVDLFAPTGPLAPIDPLAAQRVRALAELGRWGEMVAAMSALERSPTGENLHWRGMVDLARLVYLAVVGKGAELEELLRQGSFAEELPRDLVARWRRADPGPVEAGRLDPELTRLVLERARQSAAMPRSLGGGLGLAPLTTALVVANLACFALAWRLGGVESAYVLSRLGASYSPAVVGQEPWRLVAATFLHFGWVHLSFNLFALWFFGRLAEQLFGTFRFLVVYAAGGLVGGLTSLFLGGEVFKLGASGAILGVIGGAAALVWIAGSSIPWPPQYRRRLAGGLLVILLASLVFGFWFPMVDNLGHIGGALGGVAAALVLDRIRRWGRRPERVLLAGAAGLAGAAVLWGALSVAAFDPMAGTWKEVRLEGFTLEAPIWWQKVEIKGVDYLFDQESTSFTLERRQGPQSSFWGEACPAPPPWRGRWRRSREELPGGRLVDLHRHEYMKRIPGGWLAVLLEVIGRPPARARRVMERLLPTVRRVR